MPVIVWLHSSIADALNYNSNLNSPITKPHVYNVSRNISVQIDKNKKSHTGSADIVTVNYVKLPL
jgi:hypothetical protein